MDKSTSSCVVCRKLVRKPMAIFKFPADAERRQMWVIGVRNVRPDWQPIAKSYSVCELHFSKCWIERCRDPMSRKRTILRPGAFPDLLFKSNHLSDLGLPATSKEMDTIHEQHTYDSKIVLVDGHSDDGYMNGGTSESEDAPQTVELATDENEASEHLPGDSHSATVGPHSVDIFEPITIVETVDDVEESECENVSIGDGSGGENAVDDTAFSEPPGRRSHAADEATAVQKNIAVLSDEEREYIIDMIFNQGITVNELSKQLGCTKDAIYGVTRAFREVNKPKGQLLRSPALNKQLTQQEEEALLQTYLRSRRSTTIRQLEDYIESRPDMFPGIRALSKRTLYRILKRSRELTHTGPAMSRGAKEHVLDARVRYVQEMMRLERTYPGKVVFVDMCGYELGSGDGILGAKSMIEKSNVRGGKVSLCVALSETTGVLHSAFRLKLFTTDGFLQFFRELVQKLPNGQHVFVLEDLPFNKAPELVSYFKTTGDLVRYFPHGSSFLNPLGEGFTAIRASACGRAFSKRCIVAALHSACQSVTAEQGGSWIGHSRSYYERCLNREFVSAS